MKDINISDSSDSSDSELFNSENDEESAITKHFEKRWDVFQIKPPSKDTGSSGSLKWIHRFEKTILLVSYITTSLIVFGATLISKGTSLFMIAQISVKNRTLPFCNADRRIPDVSKDYIVDWSRILFDTDKINSLHEITNSQNKIVEMEQIAWIWSLIFAYGLPHFFTFLRSLRILFFKQKSIDVEGLVKKRRREDEPSRFFIFSFVLIMETCHTLGVALLTFLAFPQLDSVHAMTLTNCLSFIPGLLTLLTRAYSFNTNEKTTKIRTVIVIIIDILGLICQLTGILNWPVFESTKTSNFLGSYWALPMGLILTSCAWWEVFVDKNNGRQSKSILNFLYRVRKNMIDETRYKIYILSSLIQILFFFLMAWLLTHLNGLLLHPLNLFTHFRSSFDVHWYKVREVREIVIGDETMSHPGYQEIFSTILQTVPNTPLWVLLIQIFSTYISYIFSKFACKVQIQGFSFALPLSLMVPSGMTLILIACGSTIVNKCVFFSFLPRYLFFECPLIGNFTDYFMEKHLWLWVLWYISQLWFTLHIWFPKSRRLASTEQIFGSPMYSGLFVEQSLLLNRRRDGSTHKYNKSESNKESITRIYGCATLWHETKDEMLEILKSIFRIDKDYHRRRMARLYLNAHEDFYKWETHILFDDAFDYDGKPGTLRHENNIKNENGVINKYVRDLLTVIDTAASFVHSKNIRISLPKKFPTPYGGRLLWKLPGGTKIVCHLKDKYKVRTKKRWSQCMYMYYLLGFRLMDDLDIPDERKEIIAENTYLLALDGDIDFQPSAVLKLVDLMKKDSNLGAACGRIHPLGSGFMKWYQTFEYAIGHWLQKSTEHIMGCVLCSPGCFSLFRAKALMDYNVMKMYTTTSEKPLHFVQYDQGEDRWLCTLLLQRGWRVAYAASSDAYTFVPEAFNEFFNQRRRWMPSTIANIFDLLSNYKQILKVNKDISSGYIIYQMMMMVGTILGPGTIFLMLVGAFTAAFGIPNWDSFLFNLIPIIVYMIVCYTLKSEIQLFVAQILSAGYALVMMAVLVGIMIQISEDGPLAPSSLSLFLVAFSFVIAALLHPQEIHCLPYGVIYYVTIPAMYLLLVIYSIFNLNVVSWGTRDVVIAQEDEPQEPLDKFLKNTSNTRNRAFHFFENLFQNESSRTTQNQRGEMSFSLSRLFQCTCCLSNNESESNKELVTIAESLKILNQKISSLESNLNDGLNKRKVGSWKMPLGSIRSVVEEENPEPESSKTLPPEEDSIDSLSDDSEESFRDQRDFLKNPLWIEGKELNDCPLSHLRVHEVTFWKDLIHKYLQPIPKNVVKEQETERGLLELRNQMVFSLFMLNAIFVIVVFLLQQQKNLIFINWPFNAKANITFVYNPTNPIVEVNYEYLQLEPIGFVFILFFAVVLVIQNIGMFYHRVETLMHIIATTYFDMCNKTPEDLTGEGILRKKAKKIVKTIEQSNMTLNDDSDVEETNYLSDGFGDLTYRRPTVSILKSTIKNEERRKSYSLHQEFKKNLQNIDFQSMSQSSNKELRRISLHPNMMKSLVRRQTLFREQEERRKSVVIRDVTESPNDEPVQTSVPRFEFTIDNYREK